MPEAGHPPMRFFECVDCDDFFDCLFSNDYKDPLKWWCKGIFYLCPPFIFGLWPDGMGMRPCVIYCDPEIAQIDLGNTRVPLEPGEKYIPTETEDVNWDRLKKPIKGYPFPF